MVAGIAVIGALVIFGIQFIKQRETAGGFGCSGLLGKKCAIGENCVDGVCKKPATTTPAKTTPTCSGGQIYDSVSKVCVPSCGTGQIYDPITKKCVTAAGATAEQQCENECQATQDTFGQNYTCEADLDNGTCECTCTRNSSNRVRAFLASGGIPFQDPRMTVQDISNLETAYNAIDGQTLPFFRTSFDKTRHSKMRFSGQV